MVDVFIYIVDIPVSEMVVPCLEGYTVYIDVKLSYEEQLDAYRHAMKHINGDDWGSDLPADEIEGIRHEVA